MNAETKPEKQLAPWVSAMSKAEDRFTDIAASHNAVNWKTEASYARQAIQANPKLQECTEASVINAVINIAGSGLSISPVNKEAYLVPRTRKIKQQGGPDIWIAEAHLDISYRGLCKLATNSGVITWIQAEVVREGEKFRLHDVDQKPTHERDPFDKNKGEIVGAYCVVKLANGDYLTEAMSREELDEIRNTSTAYQNSVKYKNENSVWHKWPLAMCRKTVVRRASKLWPASGMERFNVAVDSLNQYDGADEYRETEVKQSFTLDQRNEFDRAIAESDGTALWHMERSIETGVWLDLTRAYVNTAPKNDKGHFRNKLKTISDNGFKIFETGANQLKTAMDADDKHGAIEILADFEGQEETLKEQLDTEVAFWVQEILS